MELTVKTFGRGYYGRMLAYVAFNYNEKEAADEYVVFYKYHGSKNREISQDEFNRLNGLMKQANIRDYGLFERQF